MSVVAIVAAYRPPAELAGRVAALARQVDHVIVVDDGSPAGSEEVFAAVRQAGARLIRQGQNTGIAAALNSGIEAARALGADFVLTLDQDSSLSEGYVVNALATWQRATEAGLPVGFVAAASYGKASTPTWPSNDGFVHAFDPMQSGSLIPVSTLDALGVLDEALFIDGVDSEFTARARAHGMAVLVGEGCAMEHDLGRREPVTFFGRRIGRLTYNHHSALRVYYITRNGSVLVARYWRALPRWTARRLRQETIAHGMRLVLGARRSRTLRAMFAGWADAARGRRGRIRPALAARLS